MLNETKAKVILYVVCTGIMLLGAWIGNHLIDSNDIKQAVSIIAALLGFSLYQVLVAIATAREKIINCIKKINSSL